MSGDLPRLRRQDLAVAVGTLGVFGPMTRLGVLSPWQGLAGWAAAQAAVSLGLAAARDTRATVQRRRGVWQHCERRLGAWSDGGASMAAMRLFGPVWLWGAAALGGGPSTGWTLLGEGAARRRARVAALARMGERP